MPRNPEKAWHDRPHTRLTRTYNHVQGGAWVAARVPTPAMPLEATQKEGGCRERGGGTRASKARARRSDSGVSSPNSCRYAVSSLNESVGPSACHLSHRVHARSRSQVMAPGKGASGRRLGAAKQTKNWGGRSGGDFLLNFCLQAPLFPASDSAFCGRTAPHVPQVFAGA